MLVPLGSVLYTASIKVSMFAKAAWLSAAPTTTVIANLTFKRLVKPPIDTGVM
jgi:hypothetical protein